MPTIITDERIAASHITWAATLETDLLDFDFASDEAAMINAVEHTFWNSAVATDVTPELHMELSMDPDRPDVAFTDYTLDGTIMDWEVLCAHAVQYINRADDAAGGGTGWSHNHAEKAWDWSHRPAKDRPIVLRNLLHMAHMTDTKATQSLLVVRYQLVRLTTSELGFFAARRR